MRIIDTKGDILTGDNHPQLKIGSKLYIVDDRKSTFDAIQKEMEKDSSNDKVIFELALGKEEAEEILALDLTVQGYQNLVAHIFSAITGQDINTIKQNVKNGGTGK